MNEALEPESPFNLWYINYNLRVKMTWTVILTNISLPCESTFFEHDSIIALLLIQQHSMFWDWNPVQFMDADTFRFMFLMAANARFKNT